MRRHGPEGRARSSGHPTGGALLTFFLQPSTINPQPSTDFKPVTNDSMRQLNPRFCRLAVAAGPRFSGTCRDRGRQIERQLSPRSVFSRTTCFCKSRASNDLRGGQKNTPRQNAINLEPCEQLSQSFARRHDKSRSQPLDLATGSAILSQSKYPVPSTTPASPARGSSPTFRPAGR